MVDSSVSPPNPNNTVPPKSSSSSSDPQAQSPPPPPLLQAQPPPPSAISFPRPPIRVTTEFDSDSSVLFNKISFKFFDSLAKLKLTFLSNRNQKGEISEPQLTFTSKHLSILYDVEEQNSLIKGSFDVGPRLHFRGAHDVKGQQGEVAMVADLADPGYKLELSSAVPPAGLPKATFKFPLGEVSLAEKEEEEVNRLLSINGILKTQLLNGVCTAKFDEENLNLRYAYKDEEMSFIPSMSLPSNALSFAFKRRFGPADKLSYWYNFDSNDWSAVYKHTYGKDFKLKAGYDSGVRLGWASLWVGDESGKAKTAPMKTKIQLMLQVPQDDFRSPLLMFRVKKRWDV